MHTKEIIQVINYMAYLSMKISEYKLNFVPGFVDLWKKSKTTFNDLLIGNIMLIKKSTHKE